MCHTDHCKVAFDPPHFAKVKRIVFQSIRNCLFIIVFQIKTSSEITVFGFKGNCCAHIAVSLRLMRLLINNTIIFIAMEQLSAEYCLQNDVAILS